MKGSILLSREGINLFLAQERWAVDAFLSFLQHDERFAGSFTDIPVKESLSEDQPFGKMVVYVKDEIITMRHPMIMPGKGRAPAVEPSTLKKWLDQGHDDNGREIVMLDTRNDYEVQIGTFEGAIDFGIENFSSFPRAFRDADDIKDKLKDKTVVSFCTGGIRCEKAALFLRESAVENVLQLDGGILRYFEEVGGAHWNGECFVFDRRRAVDTALNPSRQKYEFAPKRNVHLANND